jgi:hypothetical protein
LAWQRYDEAITLSDRQPLRQARGLRHALAARNTRARERTFTDIVNRVLPVPGRAASASGQHAADLLAHMGWADFLRIREGTGLDPQAHYRKALARNLQRLRACDVGHPPWSSAGRSTTPGSTSPRHRERA